MKTLLFGTALAGLLAAAQPAAALPSITGTLNLVGLGNFTGTQVTFNGGGSILAGGTSGDFSALAACSGCISMTSPLSFSPFTPGLIYSGTDAGVSTGFTSTGEVAPASNNGKTLALDYAGTATLSGFAPTPGEWVFTMNQLSHTITGSWSSTNNAVPEPASLGILGAGLIGLAAFTRRRRHP